MSQQTLARRRGATQAAAHYPEDRHRHNILRTPLPHHDPTQQLPCSKEEPDTYPSVPRREQDLHRTLYLGSARPFSDATCTPKADTMAHGRYNYSHNNGQEPTWNGERMPVSPQQSSQQYIFPAQSSANTNAQSPTKRGKRSQPAGKRLAAQDFHDLVHLPHQYCETLHDYVGADSRYTLAGTHAGIYVRAAISAVEMPARLREAHGALVNILNFFAFVHTIPKETLKSEQKGCFTLRVCYCSLTALLGDFSGSSDVPPSDPQAPILARHQLTTFRDTYPPLRQALKDLSVEFEHSINTYRHRRSPSASVVAKLQGILRTLEVWNHALGDDTFTKPTGIIRTWLDNHPTQVNGTHRMRVPSGQSSPCPSELRTSPGHYDSSLFDQYNTGPPHPSPSYGAGLPPNMTNTTYLSPPASYSQGLFVDGHNGPTYYGPSVSYDLSGMYGMSDPGMSYRG